MTGDWACGVETREVFVLAGVADPRLVCDLITAVVGDTRRQRLGSARVSCAGDSVLGIADFFCAPDREIGVLL